MQLDPRTKLYVDKSAAGQALSEAATSKIFPGTDDGARSTADVLVMASKLAYENESVIKKVVTEDWNVSVNLAAISPRQFLFPLFLCRSCFCYASTACLSAACLGGQTNPVDSRVAMQMHFVGFYSCWNGALALILRLSATMEFRVVVCLSSHAIASGLWGILAEE